MTTDRRPSRIPVRGSLALAITIGGLALLMGFRGPEDAAFELALAAEPTPDPYPTTTTDQPASTTPEPSPEPTPASTVSASPAAEPAPTPTPSPTPETQSTQTATGSAYEFRWGIVQVAVTVEGDDIVAVEALQLPTGDRRSASISQQVEPMLRASALAADSADIDVVSGATYTSLAYAYSLQSALDQLAG